MTNPLRKTYADYIGLGYDIVSAYYADGFHFQVLKSKEDVVLAQMPHGKIIADGFLSDADIQITRVLK